MRLAVVLRNGDSEHPLAPLSPGKRRGVGHEAAQALPDVLHRRGAGCVLPGDGDVARDQFFKGGVVVL